MVTSWNEELFVVFGGSRDIDVYDMNTLSHQRKITVRGLIDAFDIAAHASVLYVSENYKKLIHRIPLTEAPSITNWSVNSIFLTMSINKNGNVVVPCRDLNKIVEYRSIGTVVREIKVNAADKTIADLQHAIQLDDRRFLICHATTKYHRVCLIDDKGLLMRSFGGEPGSGMGQLNSPLYLVVAQNGVILVADRNNHRIVQLNSSLEFIGELIHGSVSVKEPRQMHSNKDTKRLYITGSNEFIAIIHM